MSMLKVIEVLAESKKSWDDAAQVAVNTAAKSVRNIRSINMENMSAQVAKGRIVNYRIIAKIAFGLE
jgi:flavin-binding protein dodecin